MEKIDLKELYRYNPKKNIYFIDVQLEDYRDAYSDWDYSPFDNRDLDDDLTEYLLECSYELTRKTNIVIVFHILHQEKDEKREKRSRQGMYNYFGYTIRKLSNQRIRLIKDTGSFFIIGIALLSAGTVVHGFFAESMVLDLIGESFFIGGWVMIWEMFSTWFFNIKDLSHMIKHYIRLRNTPIIFTYNNK